MEQKKPNAGHANLRPFVKGDPRINRAGRPKDFLDLRKLAKAIADEPHPAAKQDGKNWTRVETIMRTWASSSNPAFQKAFVEIAYGKTPDMVDVKLEDKTKRKQTLDLSRLSVEELAVLMKAIAPATTDEEKAT
jgi:hypothetical protein